MDRKEKIQIAFLIIMLGAVFGLIFCGIKIVKYHDMLTNPLGYSLDHFNIESCTCYGENGAFEVKAISNQKGDAPGEGINKQNFILPTKIPISINKT